MVLLIAYIGFQALILKASHKPKKNKAKKNKSLNKANRKPSNDFVGQIALDDKKVIASITGALAVYLGTSAGNIVIRSYRRIGSNSPAWRRAGQRDQVFNKF